MSAEKKIQAQSYPKVLAIKVSSSISRYRQIYPEKTGVKICYFATQMLHLILKLEISVFFGYLSLFFFFWGGGGLWSSGLWSKKGIFQLRHD